MYPRQPTADSERPGCPHPPSTAARTGPVPSAAALTPGRQLERSVSWSGRERLRFLWCRLRLTIAEMNYATRRVAELQAPWISDHRWHERQLSMTTQMGKGQRRPIREEPAFVALVIMAAVLAGCASPVTAGPGATPTRSGAAAASTRAAARIFTSRHYGYSEALPAGWQSAAPATRQWDGKGSPGYEDSVVDLFSGPGGVEAWALAAPTKESLVAYARATIRAAAAAHPCPAVPQTDQAITIGGAPARLLGMQCPAGSGFLVETAVTVRNGIGFVFASQNPTGTAPADRAAFRAFLAGIRLRR
jgi:hypothetical protein